MQNSPETAGRIESIIFDLDATLLDTSPLWKKSETKLVELLGSQYSKEMAQLYKGLSPQDVARTIYDQLKPVQLSREACTQKLNEFLLECYQREALKQVMGAHNWIMAFPVLVSSEEVEHGKPAPDVFLKAATELGTPPDKCLVIEDSLYGVQAAKAAGMTCFVVPSLDDPRIAETADRSFSSLADITLQTIQGSGSDKS
jgi:beta-phosphoglucomutase-like phosphatase (HAD superfamily)